MQYIITFIEGIISFISPCMLPLLPVYISYFAGGSEKKNSVLLHAFGFVAGFTLVFCFMGLSSGAFGYFLSAYERIVDIVCGVIVIFFGLSYLELIPIRMVRGIGGEDDSTRTVSSFVFGMIYSVTLTPCIGAFLGSALMMAAASGGAFQGLTLLFVYSLGLGIPFVLSAVLLERLNGVFSFVKMHYGVINKICGGFLVLVGICMILGMLNRLVSIIS